VAAPSSLDDEQPWTWRLPDVLGLLTDRQRRYVELLPRILQVKTAAGRVIPYDMQPYQAWFHAHSPLALGRDAPSRLVEKGRGLGLTLMSAMDALMLAHRNDRITIPVAGRAGDTSDEFVEKAHALLQDATDPDFFDPRLDVTSRVELGNGSRIIPLPGGSPNKVRSKRIIHGAVDEFAFHEYADKLWKAIRGSQTEGGTLDVISTHNGADTLFFRMVEDSRQGKLAFKRFYFPIHDPKAWRQDVPMRDQVAGGLRLISPWLDLKVLDEFRLEDPAGYAQEMLCDVMDAALNLLSRELVANATDITLPDWGAPSTDAEVGEDLAFRGFTLPSRPEGDLDPCVLGVDFARNGDLSAYTLWSATEAGPRQRYLEVLRMADTPTQNRVLRAIVARARPTDVLIDMTGNGTGLYDYARHELGAVGVKVHGIHFASTVGMGGQRSTPIKKAMALTLHRGLATNARLLGTTRHAELQRRHLLAVRRADLDAPKKDDEGHGDILWANALALYGLRVLEPRERVKDDGPLDLTGLLTNPDYTG
jgi:phage FluMu gp28-like protein